MIFRTFAVVALAFSANMLLAQNLVRNGDFEKIDKDGFISDFSRIPNWGGQDVKLASFLPDDEARSGNFSAKFYSAAGGFVSQKNIQLVPGKTYRFSFWVKTDMGPIKASDIYSDYPQGAMAILYPTLPSDWSGAWPRIGLPKLSAGGGKQDWKNLKGYFKADEKFSNIWIALYVQGATGTAWFDDLELVECTPEEMQKNIQPRPSVNDDINLLCNGSFELTHNPDIPEPMFYGMGAPWFIDNWDGQIKIMNDPKSPHGGKYLRLTGSAGKYFSIPVKLDSSKKDMSISFFARGTGVARLSCGKLSEKLDLSPEWKKYEFNFTTTEKDKQVSLTIINESKDEKSVIDIDALMLQYGSKVTPFSNSEYDDYCAQILEQRKQPFFAKDSPSSKVKIQEGPFTLDGDLSENIWKNAGFVNLTGTPVTKAGIAMVDGNILIGFDCAEPEMGKLSMNSASGNRKISFDDNIKISLSPWPAKDNSRDFIFTVNPNGEKSCALAENDAFDMPWNAAVKKRADGWSVEISIPAACLNGGMATTETWGVNFSRLRPENAGRPRAKIFWNGTSLKEYGKLIFDSAPCPHARIGQPKISYGQSGCEITCPVDTASKLSWKARLPSKKEYEGKLDDGILRFAGVSKVDLLDKGYAWISGSDPAGNIKAYESFVLDGKLPEAISLDFKYSIVFTGEGNVIKAVPGFADSLLSGIPAKMSFIDANGKTVLSESSDTAKLAAGTLLGKTLPEGRYKVKAELNWNSRNFETVSAWSFDVLPPKRDFTRIDRFSHMLMKGEDHYFPFALGLSYAHKYRKFYQDIAAKGFNSVILWSIGANEDRYDNKKYLEVLETLKANKIDAISVLPADLDYHRNDWTQRTFDEILNTQLNFIKQYKDSDNILMWYHFDEVYNYWGLKPVPKKEEELVTVYAESSKIDPYRPHMNNSCHGGHLYGGAESTDISSATIYTISNMGSAAATVSAGEGLSKIGLKNNNQPAMCGHWLQYYNGSGEGGNREPTAEELNCMIYGSTIAGVRAFWFFSQRPLSTHLWESTPKILNEIYSLKPVLANGNPVTIKSNHSMLRATGFMHQDKLYILTVNLSYSPIKAGIAVPPGFKATDATVEFENRKMPVVSGNIVDEYAPLERHVFILDK